MKKAGPGMLIAAAFIGPGTVTTCLRAGIEDGYSLLWALLVSVLATVVLQEMAGRLGLATGRGLPEVIRGYLEHPLLKWGLLVLVLVAVVLGNAAYEAGNVAGAVLGLEALLGGASPLYSWTVGLVALLLLWFGSYRFLEKIFALLVGLMSLSFLVTAVALGPELGEVLKGLFLPKADQEGLWTVLALIGTTVVPYNLFLYASLVNEKWDGPSGIGEMRRDIVLSVCIGGVVSMAILVTAAASEVGGLTGVLDLVAALEPVYGKAARYGLGTGLFVAGISSAITAPLAAAYVARQCFGWDPASDRNRFRAVWILILLFGVLSLNLEFKPLEIIFTAQVANALVLPFIALFLWWGVRRGKAMGKYANSFWQNAVALCVILLVIGLALKSLWSLI